MNIPQLTPNSTLGDLFRHSFCIAETTLGSFVAETFEQHPYLPGAIVLQDSRVLAMISRRTFLEHLSQPYGLEIFLKRSIQVFLSIAAINDPLILPASDPIDRAVQLSLQRTTVQLYEPLVIEEGENRWSLLDFQVLLLAQTQILSLQKEELAQQSQQIVALNDRLTWQANHDPLTQLLNRRAFKRYVQEAIGDAQVAHNQHILCYIDLDRFKVVNDTCGHAAGDELLRQVATLLQAGIRKSDIVSRLGGDEFALLLRCCALEDGIHIANSLRQALEDLRFIWEGKAFRIGASIGLVSIDRSSHDLNQVLNAADSACYVAKYRGRNRVYTYQANDQELLLQRTTTHSVTELQHALEENRLCLYCQPLVQLNQSGYRNNSPRWFKNSELGTPTIVGYEILLRFQDRSGEILPPAPFIAAAERYNLMHQIDRWVIEHLFTFYQAHQPYEYSSLNQTWSPVNGNVQTELLYMINLSGESIKDEGFLAFVRDQIETYQIPPHLICFEITETVAITNFSKAERCIRELRSLGCKFALDDFGSGMSSFTYLKHLTVDFLKIDGSFVRGIVDDPLSFGIVKAIHEVGHQIGLKTIAEGVETIGVLEQLQHLGIEYAQGYQIARPQPLSLESSVTQLEFLAG